MSGSHTNPSAGSKSRRDFLKLSGNVAAASVLAGIGPRLHAGESNTIKLALVGCGGRGTGAVADAFAAQGGPVKLYAMADLFEPRLKNSLTNLKNIAAEKIDVPPERQFVGFDA
ncbi:MAG: twin-arginine translocation signal domain-containing protein, partial [Sedimentisphaerales bacterium]|nr:twin-arginine translocation signal domain-containing protein [Sedimentisphaerales bacterium]